jgi:iron(III) transport system substrate-binding protein
MEHLGPAATENWLKGLVANMARPPKGGDTDQIKAVASGECAVALTNSYYLARLYASDKAEDRAAVDKIEAVFPNQKTWGTHVNIAGAAVARHSPHPEAARKFIEYLASDQAQAYFADGNNEWPAVANVRSNNPALNRLGKFKGEAVPVSLVGMNQMKVQQMLDRVGYR